MVDPKTIAILDKKKTRSSIPHVMAYAVLAREFVPQGRLGYSLVYMMIEAPACVSKPICEVASLLVSHRNR